MVSFAYNDSVLDSVIALLEILNRPDARKLVDEIYSRFALERGIQRYITIYQALRDLIHPCTRQPLDRICDLISSIQKSYQDSHSTRQTGNRCTSEELCRRCLEHIFQKPFPETRPIWLVNPETGRRLTLDCYCHELGIALDYHGKQHYVYPNNYHRTIEEFHTQQRRDKLKQDLCDTLGVYYIVVPYDIPRDRIHDFIKWALRRFV